MERDRRNEGDDDIRIELMSADDLQDQKEITTAKSEMAQNVEFERQMEIGRKSMRKHRAVLAALAK